MNRPGHRFHPTDEEIINYFLKEKVLGHDSKVDSDIAEVELCQWEPWELPRHAVNKFDNDPVWFFFCKRVNKYSNSQRAKRTTKTGYWKLTGKDRKIWTRKVTKQVIGIKKTLVFYKGRTPNGIRTNWVIHEYNPTAPDFPNQRAYVVCRLKLKADDKVDNSTPDESESSRREHFDFGNILDNTTSEDNSLLPWNLESLINSGCFDDDSDFALQSQLHMEQGQNVNELQLYVDSSEQEKDFVNSFFVDQVEEAVPTHHINSIFVDRVEEAVHTHHSGSNPPNLLQRVYVEDSSGIDAESFLAQGTSMGGYVSSNKYQQMQMVQALSGILPSSSRDYSGDSNIPEINCLDLVREEIPTHKSQYHPKSHKILAEEAVPTIIELQADFSCKAVIRDKVGEAAKHGNAVDMLKKKNSNVESNKDLKMTKKANTKSLKSNWNEPAGTDQKGFFIFLDTPQSCNPPLVYLVNALLGIFLFIVLIREIIIFGDWC